MLPDKRRPGTGTGEAVGLSCRTDLRERPPLRRSLALSRLFPCAREKSGLVFPVNAVLLDDGVSENFPGDLIQLPAGFFGRSGIVHLDLEVLALPNILHTFMPQPVKRRADRSSLRIQDGFLQRDVNNSLHGFIVSSLSDAKGGKDVVQNVLDSCRPGDSIDRFERRVEVKQQHFVRHLGSYSSFGTLQLFERVP